MVGIQASAIAWASAVAGFACLFGISMARTQEAPPPVQREFRGVWVATVDNIDWPSRQGLTPAQQQAELTRIMDQASALNLNAVILQVRPACDALYASSLEPWSEYLTGKMGRAPEPFYDPLKLAVDLAHARGLELHAWFNPYRAHHPSAKGPISSDHVSVRKPGIVRKYGRHLWLDPGEPATQDHSVAVILDVVRRYDIDGIHIDDYFYPYKEKDASGQVIPFPDEVPYARYRAGGGTLGKDDWRRQGVDTFVERVYRETKAVKPWVKFGISPFGIWRPGNPPQIQGLDSYAELYGDSRRWMLEGWGDYFTPQLYWSIARPAQSYPTLLKWWVAQNRHGRHVWPGNYTSRIGDASAGNWKPDEIQKQIAATRSQEGATGNIHFSMSVLMRNTQSVTDLLRAGEYASPALVPASPWLGDQAPGSPKVDSALDGGKVRLRWAKSAGATPFRWVVQWASDGRWRSRILGDSATALDLPDVSVDKVWLYAVSRTGIAGPPTVSIVSR